MSWGKYIGGVVDQKLLRFLLVGACNTVLSIVMMFVLYRLFGFGYWGSSGVSYFLCSILSFYMNRHYTFGNHDGIMQAGFRFALNIGVCYAMAYLAAKPLVRFLLFKLRGSFSPDLMDQMAMLAGMVLFTGCNYLGQRLFVFPDKSNP